ERKDVFDVCRGDAQRLELTGRGRDGCGVFFPLTGELASRRLALGDRGQLPHRLVLEELTRRQHPAQAASAADDLQGNDGVAAEVEEVVVAAHPLATQDLRPQPGQLALSL